jgi:hypothetical protein
VGHIVARGESAVKRLPIAAALDAPNCRASRRGAAVAVEVPRGDPQSVRLLLLYKQLTDQPVNHPSIPPIIAVLSFAWESSLFWGNFCLFFGMIHKYGNT